ncbi:MAG: aspartate carbamoyltransferase [Anaerolineales bacterium]
MNSYYGKDFITTKGLERSDLEELFDLAQKMEKIAKDRTRCNMLNDSILGLMFFQVSTRTRISFESAMRRLGGSVVGFVDPKTTRIGDYYKESMHDVTRMMENYADVLVIRHPVNGAPEDAARITDVPIINAGDGDNEHPTQALLDLYTIRCEKGTIDDLKIGFVGDMNLRVFHSLPLALANYQSKAYFISPPDISMPAVWLDEFKQTGLDFEEISSLDSILDDLDVIYMEGVKTPSYHIGRTETVDTRPEMPQEWILDSEKMKRLKENAIILHPLPRTEELPKEVDAHESAKYFTQAGNAVPVRMALLSLILGRSL